MSEAAGAASRTEADYDALPYVSLPIAYSQPARLAAMLRIFGLEAPNAATARVLELGCASGGNLIPLAARFPNASFVGLDLSQRQVDMATRRIAELGLKNIAVRQGDLTEASFGPDAFDFIVCHGVFSWVPRAAQDAIFRICGESLSPDGVAAISFNVLPGWHLRHVVRDVCLSHVDPNDPPARRVAAAREAFATIAGAAQGQSPYAAVLRAEAERMKKAPASYVMGEFLAEHNQPCYFREFASRAAAARLAYVCEGELATSLPEFFVASAAKQIRASGGDDALKVQHYADLYSGRTFRRALLVRAGRVTGATKPDTSRLRSLHFAADLKCQTVADKLTFIDAKGRSWKPHGPSAAYIERLARTYPSTRTLDDLLGAKAGDPAAERDALNTLRQLLIGEHASASTVALAVGNADDEKPRAWGVARLEAASRQPWATGQHHEPVKLPLAAQFLLPRMDGAADRAALRQAAELAAKQTQSNGVNPDDILKATLSYAARQGLLAR